jgi:hypothetical protein
MELSNMNKVALRNACKTARISYGGMNNDAMRDALQAHYDTLAGEPLDTPTVQDAPPAVQDAPYTAPKPATTKEVKGTGLKIQADRVERNGIKQPSIGGACRSVWDACTEMQALDPAAPLKVKQVKAHAVTMGWNENNAVIEFYRWKKWSAPTVEEMLAAPAAKFENGLEMDPTEGEAFEAPFIPGLQPVTA